MTTHPTPHCPAHTASLHHRHGTARKVRRAVLETTDADLPKPQLQTSARDFGLTGSSRASSPPPSQMGSTTGRRQPMLSAFALGPMASHIPRLCERGREVPVPPRRRVRVGTS